MCASFGSTRLIRASFGSTRLIRASFGSTRLMCASFGSTRLICASFGSTRLICAFYGTTRLLCRAPPNRKLTVVRAQRGADRREAGRTREGHMDASGFLIASAIYSGHSLTDSLHFSSAKSTIMRHSDHASFTKVSTKGKIIVMLVYVHGIVLSGDDQTEISQLKSKEGISVSQRKYTLDLLTEKDMLECHLVDTPIELNCKLGNFDD
ncbi:reverse transcriptase [Cucumis melo var. makuwa]|uniref:Reverse transcriptase n=1 Tax=Cucumis melo var. makuwa TaxID=1194695 RepID=A0A5D3C034_CUCMM|nr:reverse transcriptase [Cucumis melo var. makuwa]